MDRDTTATPYKLSADGLVYFRYPDGDAPVVEVADYAELRTKGRADSATGTILLVGNGLIDGYFLIHSDDPYKQGDDGGWVIQGSDCWWVRTWSISSESPIRLDWWEPDDSFSYTQLFWNIANRGLRQIHIKTPSTASSGFLDKVEFNGSSFSLFGDTPFVFRQTSASYPKETQYGPYSTESLVLAFEDVYLASNIEFVGNPEYRNMLGPDWTERWRLQQYLLVVAVSNLATINCTVTRPIASGLTITGGSLSKAVFGGKFYDAGIDGYIGEVEFAGAEFIECSGGSLGIDPADPDGPSDLQFTRWRGFSYAMCDYMSGWLKCYGGGTLASATSGGSRGIGTAENPLDIEWRDAGKRLDFPEKSPRVAGFYNDGTGKFDGYHNGNNGVYIRFRFVGECCYLYRDITFEASPDSSGDNKYDQNMHIEFLDQTDPGAPWYRLRTNQFGEIFDDTNAGDGGIGRVYNNTITGKIGPFSVSDGPNTLNNITVLEGNWVQHVGAFGVGSNSYLLSDRFNIHNPGLYINGLTITEECAHHNPQIADRALISIGEVEEVIITDLVVEGGAPSHSLIQFSGVPKFALSITTNLINPTIPSGYVVRMAPGQEANESYYIFQVDGVTQTLPWTAP